MDAATPDRDWLVDRRREFHRRPEPAWCEFYTTARILELLEEIGVDEVVSGRDVLVSESREAVPDDETLETWYERAMATGVDEAYLEPMAGGHTGAIAVLERGEGPTIGLRVDVDALPRRESDDPDHHPAAAGFRSEHEDHMHACGHDAHVTLGLGVLRRLKAGNFSGTLKVFFQPAEEVIGGGKPLAESGHLDDLDYLFAVHVGLGHPTGEVVAGVEGMLAVAHFRAEFAGESAHAGANPSAGRDAVRALATAVTNVHAIPRHEAGITRVNAGRIGGGTASNIVPESAFVDGEVRGETTELMEWMYERCERTIRSAAEMHWCEASIERGAWAPSAVSDRALADVVAAAADATPEVDPVVDRAELGGSEDASYLMDRVQERGGLATYVGIGTDHPGGHHTATFDVDEDSLEIGVDVLATAIGDLARDGPATDEAE